MADPFRIRVDLEKVRANFARTDKKPCTTEQVKDWLREQLFIEQGEEWLCEELQLDYLDKSEIVSIEEL